MPRGDMGRLRFQMATEVLPTSLGMTLQMARIHTASGTLSRIVTKSRLVT